MSMEIDIFAKQIFGKLALKKLGSVGENFRLYSAGWLDDQRTVMKVSGAVFRVAKAGKNRGKLSIMVKGTEQTAYITADEMEDAQMNAEYAAERLLGV